MKNFVKLIIMAILILSGVSAFAAPTPVSPTFTYQGVVFSDNVPFDGTGFFKMAVVNESGQTLWSNDGTSVDGSEPTGDVTEVVNEGVFQIVLGDTNVGMVAIDPTIFDTTETLHLKAWFDDGTHGFSELTPPIRITSSVYSMNSQFFRGYSPEDFFLNSSQIVTSQIANGAVTTAQIEDDSVTGDKITAFTNNNTAFTVGRGENDTIVILADTDDTTKPGLRFDSATDKWQFSNDGAAWTDIGSGGGGGAPTDATYITQTPNGTLTNEQALSGLANGLMVNNAGVVAIANNSAGLAGQITDETGTGALVFGTSPAIGAPVITGGTINNAAIGNITPLTGVFTSLGADTLTTALQAAITIGPFAAGVGNTSEVRFLELAANGADYVGFKAPDAINPSQIWTLPAVDGAAGTVLSTNGAGVLSWSPAGTGDFKADGSVPMTGNLNVGDNNITNVGDIALDTISSDSSTTVAVTLGTNPGDDFIAGNGNALVVEGDTNRVGINTATPATTLDVNGTATMTTVDINGGNIDNTVIGNTTRAAGNFNALDADGNVTLGDALADVLTFNGTIAGATPFVFDGATPGGNTTSFAITDPTANRTITFQDGSGTVAFTSDISGTINSGTVNQVAYYSAATTLSGTSTLPNTVQDNITRLGTVTLGTWNATTIAANRGGTGQTAYTVGDILYANTASTLLQLPDVVTGNVLISGGVGTAPSWGKVGLTTHVSGTLPIANGGTNATTAAAARTSLGAAASGANSDITSLSGLTTPLSVGQGGTGAATFTQYGVLYGDGTNSVKVTGAGTTGQVLTATTGAAPTWAAPSGGGANTALSNLAGVAINTSLLPGAATIDLGSGTSPFREVYLAGTSGIPGTDNFKITGASTSGTRVITLPDVTDTLVGLVASQNITNKNIDSSVIGGTTPGAGTFTNLTANTTLTAPSAASPSVTAAGQIAVDTDDDRITFYGSAARTVTSLKTKCAVLENAVAADDGVPIFVFQKASTLVQTACFTSGTAFTVPPTYQLEDGAGNPVTGAATCGTTPSYVNTTAGNAFTANEGMRFNITNTPAPTAGTWTSICFVYREDA